MSSQINLVEKLQESQIFNNVDADDLKALIDIMEKREYPAGTVMMRRGELGDSMVEIIEGHIRIFTEDSAGNEVTLVVRGPGEVVGELSLIDDQPRSASVAAETDLKVLELKRTAFLEFLADRPKVGMQMMLTLTGRIRYTTDYLQQVVEWIQRVEEGDFDKAMESLASQEDDADAGMHKLIETFISMIRNVQQRQSS